MLRASIICFILAALTLWLMGCQHQPFPESGEKTNPPVGYYIHCLEFPDSPFCKQEDDE